MRAHNYYIKEREDENPIAYRLTDKQAMHLLKLGYWITRADTELRMSDSWAEVHNRIKGIIIEVGDD